MSPNRRVPPSDLRAEGQPSQLPIESTALICSESPIA
jgi:hypothetical protein